MNTERKTFVPDGYEHKTAKDRNEKIIARYTDLWRAGFDQCIILQKIISEFYLSEPSIYKIVPVKEIQGQYPRPKIIDGQLFEPKTSH